MDGMSTGTSLLVLPVAGLPTILAADDKDILKNLLKELEGWEPDVSTERGRKEIASKAQKVRVAKADFGRLADRLKEDAIKTQRAVNAEVKVLTERMDGLVRQVRAPLDEYEAREKSRVAGHEAALTEIEAMFIALPAGATAEHIAAVIASLENCPPRDWEEFSGRASKEINVTLGLLQRALGVAQKRENEEREASRIAAEEAERKRLADIEAQRVREERIATEAAERAKVEAEAEAAREAKEVEERSQAALRAQALVAEEERATALRKEREAAELLARVEREKQQAIDQAERDRIAAVETERRRVASEAAAKKAEDDRRAANKAHRAGINREALADLIQALSGVHSGNSEEADKIGRAVIEAVARGQVRHMAIDYTGAETKEGPLL